MELESCPDTNLCWKGTWHLATVIFFHQVLFYRHLLDCAYLQEAGK